MFGSKRRRQRAYIDQLAQASLRRQQEEAGAARRGDRSSADPDEQFMMDELLRHVYGAEGSGQPAEWVRATHNYEVGPKLVSDPGWLMVTPQHCLFLGA